MLKKLGLFLVITTMVVTLSACSTKADNKDTSEKIKVVVSFNAMKEFVEAVGKDKVDVHTMIPEGTEPHDFEPKAKDMEELNKAQVFVFNGFGMEKWTEATLEAVDNKKLISIDASKGATPIINTDTEVVKADAQSDPHLWLSFKGAESQSKNIKDGLVKADPTNKDYYEKNYLDFYNKLEDILKDYNTKFSSLTNKTFVTGHAAFAYLAKDFGLKQNSVEDVFAEGEPSAKKLKSLTDYCKENKIKTIFVESMASPKVSETLAKEVGAKAEKIYTIESKEDNKDYIQSMKDNIEKIYVSLK
ncbi:MAG: zinc ABC transporter substrate-binding protein [Clostridiaceae bacterium]|nr:zinc ABC transporter substrate-binding protein [Clostridiaceae bacterium]